MLLVLEIIIGTILYLIIARWFFHSFAKKDFFNEFRCISYFDFPTRTFIASIFWVITLPILLIALLVSVIAEEISTSYCAIAQVNKEAKKREGEK